MLVPGKEEAMTSLITQELEARGVAQVIIIMKEPAPMATAAPSGTAAAANAGPIVRSLVQHYVSSEMSQVSALATAAAAGRPVRAFTRAGGGYQEGYCTRATAGPVSS